MKKWINVTVINTSTEITELDADSIIGYGPQQGNGSHSTIYLAGGQLVIVTESVTVIKNKVMNAKA
jgi:hypothetical protein